MRRLLLVLAPAALVLAAPAERSRPVRTAAEAKAIAERETGGIAVSARRVPLNGATGGWEVDLRMPGEERGWRCVVDADTRSVHTRTRIPQPGSTKNPKRS
ncbi:MAG TPA: PepSY domain-containing protein [Holophaga sp.]|nr:PepSY domain-containing protein [Holophaga sp.]